MFSQTVEYALRATAHLAANAPEAMTTEQIAQATMVPRAYLSKVLQALTRAGVVRSQRGMGGGISLIKAPKDLTILEIVNAVEPVQRIKTCPLGLSGHANGLCRLHGRMDQALEQMERALGESTIAEMLAGSSLTMPLCLPPRETVAPVPAESAATEPGLVAEFLIDPVPSTPLV